MSIDNDRRELLKIRQGLIEDSDVIKKEETVKEKLKGKKAVENFFYHYKIHLLMVLFFTVLIGFFTVEALTKKKPDIDFMIVASSGEASTMVTVYDRDVQEALESFCPNFNGNSYIYAQPFIINFFNEYNSDMLVANQTKLFAEIRMGTTRMIIGNREAFDRIAAESVNYTLDDVFLDLSERYRDNENIEEKLFFRLKDSAFEEAVGIDNFFPEDMYIAVLKINLGKPAADLAHERTLEVLDNIVYGRVVNQK
ncbi:MAG: hypothetical protein FWG44_03270 [Oscillospiraceae bacterium]|nr:hypothetical protein [Oscillospiraceae bacterium]